MTRAIFRTALIPAALLALAACNTVEGVGEDVEAGGKAIQKGAEKVSRDISE